ncbi:MAG: DoxX family protein [Candidatus Sulfotelmatobacter sp.]
MSAAQTKLALTVLQWVLGVVILAEAVQFVMPGAAHDFARTHLPGFIRMILGYGEIVGCILLLIPPTAIRGAWILVGIFTLAIVTHLLHGMYGVGNLVIYTAAAWAIATGKGT